jgi:Holliday junction DNA helicase RuvA
MIGRLCGRMVTEEPDGSLVLDVHGVGYDVMAPLGTARRAGAAANAEGLVLHIHTHVREDSIELFGFATETERRVFRLLIGVPNVGPKTALGVLSALPSDELAGAVRDGDLARLGRVPGIGKKTAERLVLELKGKLPEVVRGSTAQRLGAEGRDNAARLQGALTNMGYRAAEAEQAVKALGGRVNSEPDSELLREALAWLTR